MLVATLGVVEADAPAIFEKMQPKAKVAMTVRNMLPLLLLLLLLLMLLMLATMSIFFVTTRNILRGDPRLKL